MKRIRFINTFEPVIPLYKYLGENFQGMEESPKFLVSQGLYRYSEKKDGVLNSCMEYVWVPKIFRHNKRICALLYFLQTPFILLFHSAELNVFLTQPPLFFMVGAWISKIRNTPYIIHIMDMYPDILVKQGYINQQGLLCKALDWLVFRAYSNAKGIVVLGRCMKNRLVTKGVPESKIRVLHNWSSIDPEHVEAMSTSEIFRNKFNIGERFVVMYSGNMGTAHEFSTLLEVANDLKSNENIVFIFVGDGTARRQIENYVNSHNLKNIQLYGYQSNDSLIESLTAADVHFVSLRSGFEGLMVPSKLYGVIACARPVIFEGEQDSEIARMINDYHFGINVPVGNSKELKKAILKLFGDTSLRNKMGAQASNTSKLFSKQNAMEIYSTYLKENI